MYISPVYNYAEAYRSDDWLIEEFKDDSAYSVIAPVKLKEADISWCEITEDITNELSKKAENWIYNGSDKFGSSSAEYSSDHIIRDMFGNEYNVEAEPEAEQEFELKNFLIIFLSFQLE